MITSLMRWHARQNLVTTGWIEDVYPNERGWVDQPDNIDPKHRVFYGVITTRRRRHDDY
jgi:hypothetical protein